MGRHAASAADRGVLQRSVRKPGLDGVRAIGVILVLLFHSQIFPFRNGAIGVDVFFVLSGYLITALLTEELERSGSVDFGRFYGRRALRLLPAYLAVVMFALAIQKFWPSGGTVRGAISSLLYCSNWVLALHRGGLGYLDHTWSLSIEEQFYLVWPLLVVLGCRLAGRRKLTPILVVAFLALASVADGMVRAAQGNDAYVYAATDTRASALLVGAALALTGQYLARRGTVQ
jgi:peptidoglycan/LPS O-acetylase OafA/YrhL